MRRTSCLQCVIVTGTLQLVLTYLVVYLVMSPATEDVHAESRLLLSLSEPSGQRVDISSEDRLAENQLPMVFADRGLLDKWRKFKTHLFAVSGTDWRHLSDSRKVCLATQTSIDRAHWLLSIVEYWSGPISVAIFTPDIEYDISRRFIAYLRTCHSKVLRQVSFHFVYPVDHSIKEIDDLPMSVPSVTCEQNPKDFLKELLKFRTEEYLEWRESLEYPQNLMRNIAKSGCQTNYTFVPDVDMIPSPNLDIDMDKFLDSQQDCDKCAFVVPVYEISDQVTHFPQNKTELIQYVNKGTARYFHKTIYKLNQKSSNLSEWEKIPQAPKLEVAYKVTEYLFKYEPLYIARANAPQFDERFIGFGMTRNTQVYEMYVAGYSFNVLNNAFASHWGFQTLKSRPEWRAKQQERNNARFDDFAREISARYGRDPYQMLSKLKKMNLKNIKVAYSKSVTKKKI